MTAYYNENDPQAAAWLRELIRCGHIAPGDVDERDIRKVKPDDVAGYTQAHWFGGIGGWSLALRLAGWSDDRPVWTGSCPCQPFSAAGKKKGEADDRHLWPDFYRLIRECRPVVMFGEQVEGAIKHGWLDGVSADLEGEGYAVGAVVLGAHSVSAPHIRQRLFWVADAGHDMQPRAGQGRRLEAPERTQSGIDVEPGGMAGGMADTERAGVRVPGCGENATATGGMQGTNRERQRLRSDAGAACDAERGEMEYAQGDGREQRWAEPSGRGVASRCGVGFWSSFDLIPCRDGKTRRVGCPESHALWMANGISVRMAHVLSACAAEAKEAETEILSHAAICQTDPREALLYVWVQAYTEAVQWTAGGHGGVCEASILLAYLRQLQEQGWPLAQSLPRSREEATEARLRVLRGYPLLAGASSGRGLDEQQSDQPSNALHLLPSLLARHAHQAWGEVLRTDAQHATALSLIPAPFPLVKNMPGRVGLLRGYGNAIVPTLAAQFITAYLEAAHAGKGAA